MRGQCWSASTRNNYPLLNQHLAPAEMSASRTCRISMYGRHGRRRQLWPITQPALQSESGWQWAAGAVWTVILAGALSRSVCLRSYLSLIRIDPWRRREVSEWCVGLPVWTWHVHVRQGSTQHGMVAGCWPSVVRRWASSQPPFRVQFTQPPT